MKLAGRDYWLEDDGTTDTVIGWQCQTCGGVFEERIDCETAGDYRDPQTGGLAAEALHDLVTDLGLICDDCPNCGI
jgi:hypothetical protein